MLRILPSYGSPTRSPSISICEWTFGGRGLADILGAVVGAGYDALEIAGEPGRDLAALRDLPLPISGTSAMGRWPTAERDLTHEDSAARARAVAYYRECVDLAVAVGAPSIGLNVTASGRLAPMTDRKKEWRHAVEGLREIGEYAGEAGIRVGVEPLNRYETHLLNQVSQALELCVECDNESLGAVADVFHMQFEEEDPVRAVGSAGDRLLAIHLADSTRRGLGHGRLMLEPIIEAAVEAGFQGPLVMEFTAPGPEPFEADKGPEAMRVFDTYVQESAREARAITGRMAHTT